jgi:hypothetical protein
MPWCATPNPAATSAVRHIRKKLREITIHLSFGTRHLVDRPLWSLQGAGLTGATPHGVNNRYANTPQILLREETKSLEFNDSMLSGNRPETAATIRSAVNQCVTRTYGN